MVQVEIINVAIVGGGPGCRAVMDIILSETLNELRMRLVGVASTNPTAVGYLYAKEKGIYTTRNYHDFYQWEDLDLIIELTGRDDVVCEILHTKPDWVRVIDHVVARLFWDIFRIEEARIAERKIEKMELLRARNELEGRVMERTAALSEANALLKQEVAERRQAESELQKRNEELERFADVVSHDLKTPSIAVQGFASLFLKEFGDGLNRKGRRYVEQIRASGRRMETLISDLLCLARAGKVVSAFEDVSSGEIVNEVEARLRPSLLKRGAFVDYIGTFPVIRCDKDRMSQVFENLMVNAIKFLGEVETPRIQVGYEDREADHLFFVRDNGIGIDPAFHKKIFQVFERLGKIKDAEGTGMGLAIVEKIILGHGGKIWVDSQEGKGATFYFFVPKAPEAIQSDSPPCDTP